MLVLTRKINEALLLEEGAIRIVVLGIQGDQVRLGIEAPRHISVMREEIVEAQAQNQRAAQSVSPDDLASFTTPKAPPGPGPTPKSR
ncbi:MAG: carbon storage regulator CsrA [Firmicutes bacterium]|jgi:carbon storage regulator|nr:carbon storage regulator CsrA [Bacillota bacterium]